jgi:LacI family transcriptional regulator
MPKNKNIRIKDIAEMSGVSEGTVDRVIHNRGGVSPEVEKKIKGILEKTDYTPNPIARSLGAAKDFHIAVMMPEQAQDPYWEMAGEGIERAQKEWASYNLHINLFPFDLYDSDSFSEVSEHVVQTDPDAVCTVPMFYEESLVFFENLHKMKIPYVLFNTQMVEPIKKYAPFCFIGPNLYHSGRVAAELMDIALSSPRKFAIMHVHENIESSVHLKEKERGFKDYYREKQANPEISSHSFLRQDQSFEEQISHIIAETTFDGIFVSTSSASSITANALKIHGKEGIHLIGFDLLKQNIHFLKTGVINFLINQNPQFQTYGGIRYLVNNLLFNEEIPSIHQLPIEIVTRENCESFLTKAGSQLA